MKKFLSALCLAVAVAIAPAIVAVPHAVAQGAESVQAMEADIEALLITHAGDPDAFAAAIEDYVIASGDPELAADAVINVLTRPTTDPAMKVAGGKGLGAAIALIGLTNPTAAANMQAKVEASGDATLQAAVADGNAERTASIQRQQQQQQQQQRDSTPETPVSPS